MENHENYGKGFSGRVTKRKERKIDVVSIDPFSFYVYIRQSADSDKKALVSTACVELNEEVSHGPVSPSIFVFINRNIEKCLFCKLFSFALFRDL